MRLGNGGEVGGDALDLVLHIVDQFGRGFHGDGDVAVVRQEGGEVHDLHRRVCGAAFGAELAGGVVAQHLAEDVADALFADRLERALVGGPADQRVALVGAAFVRERGGARFWEVHVAPVGRLLEGRARGKSTHGAGDFGDDGVGADVADDDDFDRRVVDDRLDVFHRVFRLPRLAHFRGVDGPAQIIAVDEAIEFALEHAGGRHQHGGVDGVGL